MKTKCAGIIAEYNPFHNGHMYHLTKTVENTKADVVIAAMSGSFIQRGLPAMADKWHRAAAAVECGVDLVVEIPCVFACNSAGYFASAGVEILENLGADYISFGSESGNIRELVRIAREMDKLKEPMNEYITGAVKEGISYPRARRECVEKFMGKKAASLLDSPNNILAIEYIRAARKAEPVTVKRSGAGYRDESAEGNMASATAIRKMERNGENISALLPGKSAAIFKSSPRPSDIIYFNMLRHMALAGDASDLDEVMAGGEGLGNKLKKEIRTARCYEELAESLKSKRYTRTRIDRFLAQNLLGITSLVGMKNYIRVLAFNEKGRTYLKEIKKSEICKLPVITNINKEAYRFPEIEGTIKKDILASDIYNMITGRNLYEFCDYVIRPYEGERRNLK